jgi:hypothetical protein
MRAGKPHLEAKWRYPIYCKDCPASSNGKPDWDKSCCNSCADYEESSVNQKNMEIEKK